MSATSVVKLAISGLWVVAVAGAALAQGEPSITYATSGGIFTRSLAGERQPLLSAEDLAVGDLAWSEDGHLAVAAGSQVQLLRAGEPPEPIYTSDCSRPPTLSLDWAASTLIIRELCDLPLAEAEGSLQRYSLETGALTPAVALPPATSRLYLSPDATAVAYVYNRHIYRLDLAAGTPVQLTATPADYGAAGSPLAWSPDGQSIAFYEGAYPFQRLFLMAASGGPPQLLTPDPDFQVYRTVLSWAPDSRSLAFYVPANAPFSNRETLQLVDVATGAVETIAAPGLYDGLAWSPDSQQLVVASGNRFSNQYLYRWQRGTGEFTQLTQQPLAQVAEVAWLGEQLIFSAQPVGTAAGDLANRQIYRLPAAGGELEALSPPEDYAFPWVLGP